jgi:dihydrofolate reductase
MARIVVNMNVTLDGVMQAPGRPDEDRRNGFDYGGWATPYFDPVMAENAAQGIAQAPALLFGRRTYEDFYAVWPHRTGNPFTEVLNDATKYVVTTTLREPLPWRNSTLLRDEAAVAALKRTSDRDLVILGCGTLVRSLMRHNLIDEYALSIHPLVLGEGRQLFEPGVPYGAFELVNTKTTTTGVVIATYRPTVRRTLQ